jgi:hypothetical protein
MIEVVPVECLLISKAKPFTRSSVIGIRPEKLKLGKLTIKW